MVPLGAIELTTENQGKKSVITSTAIDATVICAVVGILCACVFGAQRRWQQKQKLLLPHAVPTSSSIDIIIDSSVSSRPASTATLQPHRSAGGDESSKATLNTGGTPLGSTTSLYRTSNTVESGCLTSNEPLTVQAPQLLDQSFTATQHKHDLFLTGPMGPTGLLRLRRSPGKPMTAREQAHQWLSDTLERGSTYTEDINSIDVVLPVSALLPISSPP